MAIRKIFTVDEPCLHKKCRQIENFDQRLWTLLDDLADTLHSVDGVGLAAPQIGILRRAVVIDLGEGIIELINPVVTKTSGKQGGYEGCLSCPEQSGYVERPNKALVKAQDRYGKKIAYTAEELFARAVLHETDHLDGLIFTRLITEPPEEEKTEEVK